MEGGCTCGELRFRLTDSPLVTHCCHCTWCQRLTGSAFVVNAWIEADRVTLVHGTPVEIPVPTPSGGPCTIARCPNCAAAIWTTFGPPMFRFVRVGALDDPAALRPDMHIYTGTKLPWVQLGDDIPAYEEYYRRSKVWRPEALERFETTKAKG